MQKLTNIPTLARTISELANEIKALQSRPEPQPLPDDLARLSDIPAPPDLLPLDAKIQELEQRIEGVAESVRTSPVSERLAELSATVEAQATQAATIRADLTETRRWLAEMGRSGQAHREESDRRIADLADRIPDVSGFALAADVPDITDLARAEDIPAVPDLAPLAERVLSVEKELADLADRIPDDETITSIADARAGARVGPVKGRLTQLWASLGAEADRIDAIRSDISEIKEDVLSVQSRKCPALPDPPEPVDVAAIASALASLAGRCEQIENDMESMRRAIQCAAPSEAVDDLAARQASIRETLTETRRWLADLGRKVQGGKS